MWRPQTAPFGFWILEFGFWILDFGSWILDFGFGLGLPCIVWILHKIFPCHADSGRRISSSILATSIAGNGWHWANLIGTFWYDSDCEVCSCLPLYCVIISVPIIFWFIKTYKEQEEKKEEKEEEEEEEEKTKNTHLIFLSPIWPRQHGRPCIGSQKQLRPCIGVCGRCGCIFSLIPNDKTKRWHDVRKQILNWPNVHFGLSERLSHGEAALGHQNAQCQAWPCSGLQDESLAVLVTLHQDMFRSGGRFNGNFLKSRYPKYEWFYPHSEWKNLIWGWHHCGKLFAVVRGGFSSRTSKKNHCRTRCLKWWDMCKGRVSAERGMNSWTPRAIHQRKPRLLVDCLSCSGGQQYRSRVIVQSVSSACFRYVYIVFLLVEWKKKPKTQCIDFPSLGISNFSLKTSWAIGFWMTLSMARCLREARKGGKSCHGRLDETRGCFKQVLPLGLRWHRSSGNFHQKKGVEDWCIQQWLRSSVTRRHMSQEWTV